MDQQNGEILENVNNDKDEVSFGETMFFDIKVSNLTINFTILMTTTAARFH